MRNLWQNEEVVSPAGRGGGHPCRQGVMGTLACCHMDSAERCRCSTRSRQRTSLWFLSGWYPHLRPGSPRAYSKDMTSILNQILHMINYNLENRWKQPGFQGGKRFGRGVPMNPDIHTSLKSLVSSFQDTCLRYVPLGRQWTRIFEEGRD